MKWQCRQVVGTGHWGRKVLEKRYTDNKRIVRHPPAKCTNDLKKATGRQKRSFQKTSGEASAQYRHPMAGNDDDC